MGTWLEDDRRDAMKTGWPPGLLQDDSRALSKWLAGRMGARWQIKGNTMTTLVRCPLCGEDKGYRIDTADTYRWWTVCCGACGRKVDECRSDGSTSMTAAKPLSWPAADEVWNQAGALAETLRTDSDLLAWVLAHPETCAEVLLDAAAGDGDARALIEQRRAGLAASRGTL